jgi:predicted enzyme related to lactoylglutathione lyase
MIQSPDDARRVAGDDDALRRFYRDLCDGSPPLPIPVHLEVPDLEATLSRVWDLGGTIVSVVVPAPERGGSATATFVDPRGNRVSVVEVHERTAA